MEHPDINNVLKVYLGADANGGYQPLGLDKRLRAAFPRDYSRIMELISRYLEEDQTPDWSKGTLASETDRFAEALKHKFPELDTITIRALTNESNVTWVLSSSTNPGNPIGTNTTTQPTWNGNVGNLPWQPE